MDQKQRRASCLSHAVPRSSRYSEWEQQSQYRKRDADMRNATLLDHSDRRTLRRLTLALCLGIGALVYAIIDGADPAANAPGKPDPMRELFAQNYRILRRPR